MKNNTKKSKTLHFEGAGCSEAENNGVGNCRIRATFENKQGEEIYLEMTANSSSSSSHGKMRLFKFPWHISHVFKTKDSDKHFTEEYRQTSHVNMEYTKENILKYVNECLRCKFENIEILNSDWSGFSITGENNV